MAREHLPTRTSDTRPGSVVRWFAFGFGAALALAAAWTAGRLAGPSGDRPATRTVEARAPQAAFQPAVTWPSAPPGAGPGAPAQPAAFAPPAPNAPAERTPEVVARVYAEATSNLESIKPELAARCAPNGAGDARYILSVTFDASGREIARGLVEDRNHRSTAVANCLRAQPLGTLRVSPPGTAVGVRVALNLP